MFGKPTVGDGGEVIESVWAIGRRRREAPQPAELKAPQGEAIANGDGHVIVGKGASIVGEITNCTQVEIAGALEGKVVAEAVIVRASGWLKGTVCSERAEVHGTIEGQVQVEQHLDIRSTGRVSGELAYGRLSVASGGCLAGNIQLVPEHEKRADQLDGVSAEANDTVVGQASST